MSPAKSDASNGADNMRNRSPADIGPVTLLNQFNIGMTAIKKTMPASRRP